MKTLLLMLGLALTCAALDTLPKEKLSVIRENYKPLYIASTNPNKTKDGGDSSVFIREVVRLPLVGLIRFGFYINFKELCLPYYEYVSRKGSNEFVNIGPLKNSVKYMHVLEDALIIVHKRVDEFGGYTKEAELLARSTSVPQEDFDTFLDVVREEQIPEENLVDVIDRDNCPKNFPKLPGTLSITQKS